MAEENKNGLDALPEIEETFDENGNDVTDWKALANTYYEHASKYRGVAGRNYTELERLKNRPSEVSEAPKEGAKTEKKKGFDYAEKAYLKASGVESEYFDVAFEAMQSIGTDDIDRLLSNKYFQADLKERREAKANAEAMPQSSPRRAAMAAKDTVDYWIGKGELPPPDQVELRRKVVAEKRRRSDSSSISPFSLPQR